MENKLTEVSYIKSTVTRTSRSLPNWFWGIFNLKNIDPLEEYNVRVLKDNQQLLNAKIGELI